MSIEMLFWFTQSSHSDNRWKPCGKLIHNFLFLFGVLTIFWIELKVILNVFVVRVSRVELQRAQVLNKEDSFDVL